MKLIKSIFQYFLLALFGFMLSGCQASIDKLELNKEAYYFKKTNKNPADTLKCVLFELSLVSATKQITYESNETNWTAHILYGALKNAPEIGRVVGQSGIITFYYKPQWGNFGIDVGNVEKTVPKIIDRCA